jgi:DNA-binding transcriptional MerR regulator
VEEVFLQSEIEKRYAPSANAVPVVHVQVDTELEQAISRIPDKLAFKIGEAADLVGLKPYVLRYWETEFDVLKPKKSKHNQRMYERRDVENLLLIKKLLYRDRFSIEGAKSALKRLRKDNQRVKQIRTLAEQMNEAVEGIYDLLHEIQSLKVFFKS